MNWINIEVSTLRSGEYIGSEPLARATWLNVLAWCCEQENSGRIEGAANWGDRRWQQTCGVTKKEVLSASPLLVWDGDDLIVWQYPTDKEHVVKAKREAGSRGGKGRSERQAYAQAYATPYAQADAQAYGSTEGKGREEEGKGIGKEEEGGMGETLTLGGMEPPVVDEKKGEQTDGEWISALAASPAYEGISVAREFDKMRTWCEANKKQPTRRRFLNWLNRVELPMKTTTAVGWKPINPDDF